MSHLLVIIDCSPSSATTKSQFLRWLDTLITFCNSHLMLDEKNELTIVASSISVNKTILSTPAGLKPAQNVVPQQGQFEKFAFVTDIVRDGIVEMTKSPPPVVSSDCLLGAALGVALCRINSLERQLPSRIFVASCSVQPTSYSEQYMDLMNAFFAAQKMNVPIDSCVYMREEGKIHGSILEQGCDLTRGHYLNVPDIAGTLEYLLWIFLPAGSMRDTLLLPERRKATTRAACFCHRNIIDIGYVCSVCLSIFCTYSPICSTCQTHFKLNLPVKMAGRLSNAQNQSAQTNSKT